VIRIDGKLTNIGTFSLTGGGIYYDYADVGGSLDNRGTVRLVRMADFTAGDTNNSGTITADGGSILSIGGLTNSGQLVVNNSQAGLGTLSNSGAVSVSGSSMGTGDIVNSGSINLVYSSLSGGTLANSGSIDLDAAAATIGSIVNTGIIDLEGGSTLQVNGNISNSGQMSTSYYGNGGNTMMVGGRLTNGLTGTFSLGGASDVANIGSFVNQGALYIASGATLNVTGGPHAGGSVFSGFTNTGIVNIAQNGSLGIVGNYTQTAGQTTVDGSLNVSGRGMVNFAGGVVYGNDGTITGPIVSNASINIGDSLKTIGQLYFMGNYTQGPQGRLTFDIAGSQLGQYDQLNVSGHAQLNGLLNIDLLHSYVPHLGDTFDIMNFANESGTFSLVMGLPINGQEHFTLEYNPTKLTLDVVAGPLLSPDSGKEGLPATVPFIVEPDHDGTTLIASNIASGSAPHYGLSPTTPEPGTLLLLVSGLLCVGYSVRRRMTK
jgi:hypothetical protein